VIRLGQIGLVVAAAAALACGSKSTTTGGDKPKVAVSIFPIYDLTKRIAGDRLNVVLVLPAGQSEHGYDPTPKEIAALEGSKLGIAVGLEMDRWVENIMKSAGNPPVFRVGEKVQTIPIDVEPISDEALKAHDHGHHDDHDKKAGSAAKKDDHDDHDHDKKGSAAKKDDKKAAKDDHDDHDHDKKGSAAKPDDKKGSAAKTDMRRSVGPVTALKVHSGVVAPSPPAGARML
jgi:zinc transport system substrate-binding protein